MKMLSYTHYCKWNGRVEVPLDQIVQRWHTLNSSLRKVPSVLCNCDSKAGSSGRTDYISICRRHLDLLAESCGIQTAPLLLVGFRRSGSQTIVHWRGHYKSHSAVQAFINLLCPPRSVLTIAGATQHEAFILVPRLSSQDDTDPVAAFLAQEFAHPALHIIRQSNDAMTEGMKWKRFSGEFRRTTLPVSEQQFQAQMGAAAPFLRRNWQKWVSCDVHYSVSLYQIQNCQDYPAKLELLATPAVPGGAFTPADLDLMQRYMAGLLLALGDALEIPGNLVPGARQVAWSYELPRERGRDTKRLIYKAALCAEALAEVGLARRPELTKWLPLAICRPMRRRVVANAVSEAVQRGILVSAGNGRYRARRFPVTPEHAELRLGHNWRQTMGIVRLPTEC